MYRIRAVILVVAILCAGATWAHDSHGNDIHEYRALDAGALHVSNTGAGGSRHGPKVHSGYYEGKYFKRRGIHIGECPANVDSARVFGDFRSDDMFRWGEGALFTKLILRDADDSLRFSHDGYQAYKGEVFKSLSGLHGPTSVYWLPTPRQIITPMTIRLVCDCNRIGRENIEITHQLGFNWGHSVPVALQSRVAVWDAEVKNVIGSMAVSDDVNVHCQQRATCRDTWLQCFDRSSIPAVEVYAKPPHRRPGWQTHVYLVPPIDPYSSRQVFGEDMIGDIQSPNVTCLIFSADDVEIEVTRE